MYYLAPAMGLLLCLLVIVILLIDLSSRQGGFILLTIFLGWVVAAAVYAGLRLGRKKQSGVL
jgi:uncharacterized membrane protein